MTIRTGTSGWVYAHWRGIFYPNDLSQGEWFAYYARTFDTVEINNVYVYFNNDIGGFALQNAKTLRRLLERRE